MWSNRNCKPYFNRCRVFTTFNHPNIVISAFIVDINTNRMQTQSFTIKRHWTKTLVWHLHAFSTFAPTWGCQLVCIFLDKTFNSSLIPILQNRRLRLWGIQTAESDFSIQIFVQLSVGIQYSYISDCVPHIHIYTHLSTLTRYVQLAKPNYNLQ